MNHQAIVLIILGCVTWISCQQEPYVQGKRIYETYCLNCHMEDGSGLGELYPALRESAYLTSQIQQLPCLIYNGAQSQKMATVEMPAHHQIEPAAMTNLINYLSHQWGDQRIVTLQSINAQLEKCPKK